MSWRRVRSIAAVIGVAGTCAAVPASIVVVNDAEQSRHKDAIGFTALVEKRFESAQEAGRVRSVRGSCMLRGIVVEATLPANGGRPDWEAAFRKFALRAIDDNLASLHASPRDCPRPSFP